MPGWLAQWLEHCIHIAGVIGSNPIPPTQVRPAPRGMRGALNPMWFSGDSSHAHTYVLESCST